MPTTSFLCAFVCIVSPRREIEAFGGRKKHIALSERPYMMSALEEGGGHDVRTRGGGGHVKADVLREVA